MWCIYQISTLIPLQALCVWRVNARECETGFLLFLFKIVWCVSNIDPVYDCRIAVKATLCFLFLFLEGCFFSAVILIDLSFLFYLSARLGNIMTWTRNLNAEFASEMGLPGYISNITAFIWNIIKSWNGPLKTKEGLC